MRSEEKDRSVQAQVQTVPHDQGHNPCARNEQADSAGRVHRMRQEREDRMAVLQAVPQEKARIQGQDGKSAVALNPYRINDLRRYRYKFGKISPFLQNSPCQPLYPCYNTTMTRAIRSHTTTGRRVIQPITGRRG